MDYDGEEEKLNEDVIPLYDVKMVDGKAIWLMSHDLLQMEFTYWGTVRCLEGDPHGVGVAFCTMNR